MNGDLSDANESFPVNKDDEGSMFGEIKGIIFAMPDGERVSLTYTYSDEKFKDFEVRIAINYRGATFSAWGDHNGDIADAAQASVAPILRINGPLQMGFEVPAKFAVEPKANNEFEINTGVGTPGLGNGSFVHMKYWNQAIPEEVYPEVKISFPAENESHKDVVVKSKLYERC